jgi:FAD/FMN-containing dehydrogenase
VIFAERLVPLRLVAWIGHHRVAFDICKHFGELKPVCQGEEDVEYLGAADHGDGLIAGERQRLVDRMHDFGARSGPIAIASQHHMPAAGKKTGQAVERSAAHDHDTAHGQRLEALEVGRDVPGKAAFAADHAIQRPGNNEGDGRAIGHCRDLPRPRGNAKLNDTMSEVTALIDVVRQRFGDKAAISDPAEVEPWLTDWRGRYQGRADAILAPSSTEEVVEIMRLAAERRVPLVPQGGNTSMVGGATPPPDGSALILSLRRMNRLRSIDGEVAVAEAGMILATLHEEAAKIGRRFPLTLGARGSCTIGGLVSTNAGGTQVLRFGTMRSLVAGVEAVLPDGSVHQGLSPLKKDNRGYSLDQLLVGSEGTLGIVTAAALRLVPAVAARAVAWAGLADPDKALALLRAMEAQTNRIEGLEIVPGDLLELVLRHIPGTRNPLKGEHRWHVLVEATSDEEGEDPAGLLEALLGEAFEAGLIEDATVSSTEAQAEALWRIRDSISEAIRADGPSTAHDISVPVDRMPAFILDASAEVERAFPGTIASAFGHLGDGNVHFHVRAGRRAGDNWYPEDVEEITRLVDDLVTAAAGSISAEHGIGQMKLEELERLASPARLGAMRAIKHALDPLGIMNPGKLVR